MTLNVHEAVINIVEPDYGEHVNATGCFSAYIDQPLNRSAIFVFIVNNMTNATLGSDIQFTTISPPYLAIPAYFSGTFNECVTIIVLGDNAIEDNERLVFDIRPLSSFDRVEFPAFSGADSFILNIFDNDGK